MDLKKIDNEGVVKDVKEKIQMKEQSMLKKISLVILLGGIIMGIVSGCQSADRNKKAMLVVSFGTSYADTRAVTIEATEKRFEEKFAGYDVFRAFTSQTIINILSERDNIEVMNVKEAMEHLKKEGYGQVVVQSLHIMNGAEYDDLVEVVREYEKDFSSVSIGKAMLTSHEDYEKTIEALENQLPQLAENEAVVFMGHGTHHEANAVYAALEYAFHAKGHENVFVGTVEGFPVIDDIKRQLKKNNISKVTLMPLMLVAGDHAQNDMAGDEEDSWKVILRKEGYDVDIYMHGLGENEGIQNIFIEHAEMAIDLSNNK